MNTDDFRKNGHEIVEWIARYFQDIEEYPVKSSVKPGSIKSQLPEKPPIKPDSFEAFLKDFNDIILPGITHWQNPNFFAYFPANNSYPSILGEMLTAALGAQCMIWETSPAATELEEQVMNWLREMIGLPRGFEGVIQDSASGATLAALVTARENITGFTSNNDGLSGSKRLRVYCSSQTHSSVEKGAGIAGIGRKNVVRVRVKEDFSMDPESLEEKIKQDIKMGYQPCCVVATLGTTGATAIDPLRKIGEICSWYNIWLHVDAALGGTALLLPEMRWMTDGINYVDSFVFNPHKWMFTNFDCTAYFVKDANALIKTFEILPEYLKTRSRGAVNDYRDWGIPLGRRFRALKLWAVIRDFGVEGLQEKVREHIRIARSLGEWIQQSPDFELLAPVTINTVCFRYKPEGTTEEAINKLNEKLNHRLNDGGKIYLTHTTLNGKYTLRMVTAQTNVTEVHVKRAWELIQKEALSLQSEG
ncbi:MAG TPA: aminotransferase class I/II-fold pyridoxal phosphate-dependent enzyme [Bacteroidales bacterium]|nr:aminotransferase class I/II-fold pyridoxal phosphate-dependent enzyme [Bacteroidales bacterium]